MTERSEALLDDLRGRLAAHERMAGIVSKLGRSRIEMTGLTLEARALVLTAIQQASERKLAIILPNDASLDDFEAALRLFHRDPNCIAVYPNPSLSPYQAVSPPLAVTRAEIQTLGLLTRGGAEIVVIPARALFLRLPHPASFADRVLELRQGAELALHSALERLVENGFTRTDLVGEVGEMAFRGGILDLFPPNLAQPVRVELFGDTIESIRAFDTESQRSSDPLTTVTVLPAIQFPSTKEARGALARKLSLDFNDPHYKRDLAEKIERLTEHGSFPGLESYLPLAAPNVTFSAWLRGDEWLVIAVEPDEILSAVEKYDSLLQNEYASLAEKGKAVYRPETLLVSRKDIVRDVSSAALAMSSLHIAGNGYEEVRLTSTHAQSYVNRISELPGDLLANRAGGKRQALFVATKGGHEKIERLLSELSVPWVAGPPRIEDDLAIAHGYLPHGFELELLDLVLLSEWDLFEPPTNTPLRRRRRAAEAFITDLRDLRIGDHLVHIDHGVGRFLGLRRVAFGQTEREVMEIEYASGGKLLLPMESLNLIQKYSGGVDLAPKLDRLGGTSWARTKASVKNAMRDMADELLKLYATRQMVPGHAFSKDSPWQFEFEEAFEFDETEDQITAIDDVKHDMESRKPMDRLLCGDVGYGKTEVAMRATFKAVMDGKQVAMLAPTTILAFQHFRTFLRRFASFPVSIELLSRHWSAKEQKSVVQKLETGEIDVVIGTHRALSKDVRFKDLGLLIIDEEQRFGVAQKERLKQLKKAIDVLSMSATPIPRTLHMSMIGVRDISVIETPPKDRLAIQTAVVPFHDEFIREAIELELGRGGQIFFVHNRVESIYAMKEYLERTVPDLRVVIGHGQMDEPELEKAMMAFINRDFEVLLSTTIIENGIDIPACNTILINHAERFGLSQLYQLRGRVGRSDRLAFCYLLVPANRVLNSEARERLAAIQEFSDLGAGFRIAAKDLEIRGSGNILGGEQSGHIAAVGFEMYTRLLEEAVREIKGERVEDEVETSMNLGLDIYIPHEFIDDENLRMMFYKRIASARDESRIDDIRNEMRDRFGAVPRSVEALLEFVKLKQLAQALGVVSVTRERHKLAVRFLQNARINPNKLLELLAREPEAKFTPNGVLMLPLESQGVEILDELRQFLTSLSIAA